MATFDELREQLQLRRAQAETARGVEVTTRERYLRLEARGAPKDDVERARLDAVKFRGESMTARFRELDAIREFGPVADPTTAIGAFKSLIPILMFPVRIETRFVAGPPPQLLVRVYPDDCLVDTFEPLLSEDEARAARLYWQGIWAAGGKAEQQRGPWSQLVNTSGAGRAQWVLANFTPVSLYREPVKTEPTDVVLVIVLDAPLDDREKDPIRAYWVAAWKAGGDGGAVEAARNTLAGDVGVARADALIAATMPVNFDVKPEPSRTRATTGVQAAPLLLPSIELMDLKRHSWSSAARSALLPDRFVFLGWHGGTKEVELVGGPVLSPLVVSPDPSAVDENERLRQLPGGELIFPDDMKWMVDFERALQSGMGFRINLTPAQAARGFERAIVTGLRLSSSEKTAKQELENLFRHHRHSRSGLAILPQGTPTNNTEIARSGHSRIEDADVSFDEQKRGQLWTETKRWDDKADGQWLAEYLGVNNETFDTVHDSDRVDLAEARALNAALWPATLGRWLNVMLPVVPLGSFEWVRDFFADFVSGRGPLPAIRIGSQPYGVLPATSYSRNQWFVGSDAERVKLFAVANAIAADWRSFRSKLSYAGKSGFAPQMLLDILAAHPGSVEHTWRIAEFVEVFKQRLRDAGMPEAEITNTIKKATADAMGLLSRLGYTGTDEPSILFGYFHLADVELGGPLIDDRPLSETAPIRAYTDSNESYLAWLRGAARNAETLRRQEGFTGGKPPKALLYRFFHAALLAGQRDARYLDRQIAALKRIEKLPTARLERLFTEHLDCCAYRIDAWLAGVVRSQIVQMRGISESPAAPSEGIYLGAYAWVENLRPDPRKLTRPVIDPAIEADFPPLLPPLLTDDTNQGYIHAPSLNHAVAAAVLRNGYISNAGPARPDTFAVNLSSERVRTAMSILEGLRGGQSMGALLGYQFERGLHDRQTEELDQFILSIRMAFPLASNRLASTKTDDAAIENIEARNVVDGLAMVNHVRVAGTAYPFAGKPKLLTGTSQQHDAIAAEALRLVETWDAVADLAMSEGVFQAVLGNFDRVGAMLDALSKGYVPPEPQIVRTPVEGTGLTHRVGLHLKPGLGLDFSPVAGLAPTPRALAEPAVNEWITTLLPPLDQIACIVRFRDGANAARQQEVKLSELKLQPADVLRLAGSAQEELDERITALVANQARPDAPVTIAYMEKTAPRLALFEVLPLIRHLQRLTQSARPLVPTDLARPNDARSEQDETVFADRKRIDETRKLLDRLKGDLSTFLGSISVDRAAVVASCDAWIDDRLPDLFGRAGLFTIPQSGWSFAYELRKSVFVAVRAKAAEVLDRWNRRLVDHDALIAQYEALPTTATDAERFALLTRAEGTVTTSVTAPLPATPTDYRTIVTSKRTGFAARRDQFVALRDSTRLKVKELLAGFEACLPIAQFDLTAISTKSEIDRCVTFAEDVKRVVKVLADDAGKRIGAATKLLAQHDAAATATARVEALSAAAKALLGDDFVIVPELALGAAPARELASAYAASGSLLDHLTNVAKVDLPVDTWLYGVARVRERMRDWEQLVMFTGALGKTEPELTPLQLPFDAKDSWMALEFPSSTKLEKERLLYTAHFREAFDPSKRQCGLLLDEWTEVIPSPHTTTGVAVHYDRPNNEAPQSMLLLTPTLNTGAWQWRDVVDALYETFDLAQVRAVEPRHLDDTQYARFLPATHLEDFQ